MTNKVEKRRAFLINSLFLGVVIAFIYIFFKYLFAFLSPFIIAFALAVVIQNPLRLLDKKTNAKHHTLFSILLVVFSICIIIIPIILIFAQIVSRISEFVSYVSAQIQDLPTFLNSLQTELLGAISFLPDAIYNSIESSVNDIFDSLTATSVSDIDSSMQVSSSFDLSSISSSITSGISGVYSVVKGIPSALIAIVISIIAWIYFTKDYNFIVSFIQKQLPSNNKNILVEFKQIFSRTVLKMIRAYLLIMFITFCELFIGFSILSALGILNNSYYSLIAVLIAIFDILPVAGSGGILVPWALGALILGNYKLAIGLMVIYVIISVIRQYIEPKIVGDSLGVHPIITLAGLYFGLKLFGVFGMFVVPITVMTLKAFNDSGQIKLWNK